MSRPKVSSDLHRVWRWCLGWGNRRRSRTISFPPVPVSRTITHVALFTDAESGPPLAVFPTTFEVPMESFGRFDIPAAGLYVGLGSELPGGSGGSGYARVRRTAGCPGSEILAGLERDGILTVIDDKGESE